MSGAAGNDGADAVNYVPGSVLDAWVLGAANDNGNRKAISNYGNSVDYYAKAKYTSNAGEHVFRTYQNMELIHWIIHIFKRSWRARKC